jgi:hypothetical protein
VFVPTLALPRFVRRVLPMIDGRLRVVLLTGLADMGPAAALRASSGDDSLLDALLNDDRFVAWHAENLDFAHDKARPLPIGLDLHTLAWRPAARPSWGAPSSPTEQLRELHAAAKAARHADPRCFVHWGYISPLRSAVSAAVQRSAAFVVASGPLPRAELWSRMGGYRWVACVAGAGLDCHRTWEALALGCGVVVQDLPLLRALLGGAGVPPVLFVPQPAAVSGTVDDGRSSVTGTSCESEAALWASCVTQEALDAAWSAWQSAALPGGACASSSLEAASSEPLAAPLAGAPSGVGAAAAEVMEHQPDWQAAFPEVALSRTWLRRIHEDAEAGRGSGC